MPLLSQWRSARSEVYLATEAVLRASSTHTGQQLRFKLVHYNTKIKIE